MKTKRSEVELAKPLVSWLQDQGWDVYQEVALGKHAYAGVVADIVATQGNLIWVVEVKTSFGLKVISQAWFWTRFANFSSIAVPYSKREGKNTFGYRVLKNYGLGLFSIQFEPLVRVHDYLHPRLNRKCDNLLRESLNDNQKTFADAGNNNRNYWTPFKNTCRTINTVVKEKPGIGLKELISSIEHHYHTEVTARACISKWVQKGVIKGVRCEREGKHLRFYPDTEE